MTKKALKYVLIFLIIPLVVSIILALSSGSRIEPGDSYDSLNGTNNAGNYTYQEEIKSSNTFLYLSVFLLLMIAGGTWYYVKKKGEL